MKAFTAQHGKKKYKIQFDTNNTQKGVVNDVPFEIDLRTENDKSYHLIYKNRSINIALKDLDFTKKMVALELNGEQYEFQIKDHFDELLSSMGLENLAASAIAELNAPMPGLVLNIETSSGSEVKKGDVLLVLEAMKMENVLKSPIDGIVKEVAVNKGDSVDKNQLLISFES